MQPQIKFFAGDLGGEMAQRRIRNLIFGIKPRPRRHMGGEEGFQIGNTVAGTRGDHKGCGEGRAFVERLRQGEQLRLADQIDLVEHQHLGGADIGKAAQDRLVIFLHALGSVDQQRDQVGLLGAAPGAADHGAVEPPPRRKDAGRVDENQLRRAFDGDAANERARGLHFRA